MNCDITSVDVKSIPVLWFHEIYICISIHIYIYTHICCCFLLLLSALALFLGWYVSMHVICLSIALLVTTSTKSKSPKEIFNPYALCSHFFPPYLKMHSSILHTSWSLTRPSTVHDLSLVWFIVAWFLTGGGGFKTRRRKEARGEFSGSALCHSYLHVSQNGLWTTRATSRNMKYNPRCLQCMNDI